MLAGKLRYFAINFRRCYYHGLVNKSIRFASHNNRFTCHFPNYSNKPEYTNSSLYTVIARNLSSKKYAYYKKKSDKSSYGGDDEGDDDDDDDNDGEDNDERIGSSKAKNFTLSSLRADGMVKHLLGISRNQLEEAFSSGKLRLNGKTLVKRTLLIQNPGSQLDFITGYSDSTEEHLIVKRAEILKIRIEGDKYKLLVAKDSELVIENYSDGDPYRR